MGQWWDRSLGSQWGDGGELPQDKYEREMAAVRLKGRAGF